MYLSVADAIAATETQQAQKDRMEQGSLSEDGFSYRADARTRSLA